MDECLIHLVVDKINDKARQLQAHSKILDITVIRSMFSILFRKCKQRCSLSLSVLQQPVKSKTAISVYVGKIDENIRVREYRQISSVDVSNPR